MTSLSTRCALLGHVTAANILRAPNLSIPTNTTRCICIARMSTGL